MRIRPFSEDERARERDDTCAVRFVSDSSVHVPSQKSESFTFDYVGDQDCTQEDVFESVGRPVVTRCLEGYNGTIFAYGQTGSGKTYTMQGPAGLFGGPTDPQRGLIPRCFEHLFDMIDAKEMESNGKVQYLCKASYLEIYNETIYDLLDNTTRVCPLREDIKKGVFVDGITEETVSDPLEAYDVFRRGANNRHVSATAMNRESSRSHSVLTLVIQSLASVDTGMTEIRESRFNLVDLAGSERQKSANTSGMRLKEAANINKSLSALGKVINALVEVGAGKNRHVHYRDSKLTFLLRDSLGGNSITCIIANVSPAVSNDVETLSTLRFAQRAKLIKNKAVVNHDVQGDVSQLQAEIRRLKLELQQLKGEGISAGAIDLPTDVVATASTTTTATDAANPNDVQPKDLALSRYLLSLSLRKLHDGERQKTSYAQTIFELQDALSRKNEAIQQYKLCLKLCKAENDTLRRKASNTAVHNAENIALRSELGMLQRLLDSQPGKSTARPSPLLSPRVGWSIFYYHESQSAALLYRIGEQLRRDDWWSKRDGHQKQFDNDKLFEELDATVSTNHRGTQPLFPVMQDMNELEVIEEKLEQAQADIASLEQERDRVEFQLNNVEEDWHTVLDGLRQMAVSQSTSEILEVLDKDNIVTDEPRTAWEYIKDIVHKFASSTQSSHVPDAPRFEVDNGSA
ncbi:hypothetical protein EV182_001927 [Spiromyces aspiralis]|uniref:Uncharacterized protein n=1 Tax=Spiromyces aspiralis TaxID=68401 RepID=A0ACC1HGG0_9FUNG|nr:hypothetical protein EV182_001927 [Spiromyces aspiralis]